MDANIQLFKIHTLLFKTIQGITPTSCCSMITSYKSLKAMRSVDKYSLAKKNGGNRQEFILFILEL